MKIKALFSVLLLSLLTIQASAGAGQTYDENWQPLPAADSKSPTYGFRFQETQFENGQLSYAQSARSLTDVVECDTADLALCPSGNRNVYIVLPPCEIMVSQICIESLGFKNKTAEDFLPAKFLRTIGTKTLNASEVTGTPFGGAVSVWKSPLLDSDESIEYGVGVGLMYAPDLGQQAKNNNEKLSVLSMQATVTPVRKVFGKYAPAVKRMVNGKLIGGYLDSTEGVNTGVLDCVWQEIGIFAKKASFPEDAGLKLVIRVPSEVNGWIHGRFKDPDIKIEKLSNAINRLTVTADVAVIPSSGYLGEYKDLTAEMKQALDSSGVRVRASGSSGESANVSASDKRAFSYLSAFAPVLSDRAAALKTRWTFQSEIERTNASCSNQVQGIKGIVSTNAMIYEGTAPAFDGTSLNYKVGGLQFNPDNSPFLGSYDLLMRSEVARCYYGFSSAPISADVSVTSSDGTKQIATTVTSEKDGWIKLGAYGFQFSNPTIKVTLKQASSSPTKTSTTQKKITCIKGKVIKTISGTNPKCPTGYKAK
jgi:hypothetical protein